MGDIVMDRGPINDRQEMEPPIDPVQAARQLQSLTVGRIVAMATAGGMAITQVVLLIVGLLMLFAGKTDVLSAFLKVLPVTAAFVLAGWPAVKWIDRRIMNIVTRVTAPELVPRLLESVVNSFPLGRSRPALEQALADSLDMVDEEWWEKNRRLMNTLFRTALETMKSPTFLRPPDGPWLPALLNAAGRCGRTDQLRKVERFESAAKRNGLPEPILISTRRCIESLQERIEHNRLFGSLLRAAESPESTLLRPARDHAGVAEEVLVRPICAEETSTVALPARTDSEVSESNSVSVRQK